MDFPFILWYNKAIDVKGMVIMILTERHHKETGREFALKILKDNIIHLQLAPGSKVSETELAAQLGLSRTPVREALLELSKVKIVEIYPQKGSFISFIDLEQVEESQFMRRTLECAVVELCCEVITEQELLSLTEVVKLQLFYLNHERNEKKQLELDNQFHEMLFQIAKKPQVYTLMRNIAIHFDRVRAITLPEISYESILEDHQKILDCITNRDAKNAKEVMTLHLNRFRMAEKSIHQKHPEYFKQ